MSDPVTDQTGSLRVFVARQLPGSAVEQIAEFANVDVWEHLTPPSVSALIERTRDCHGLLSMPTERINATLLDQAPHLRVVANMGVGFDNVDIMECTARGIAVGNTPGVLTDATADLTMALILATSRRLVEAADRVRAGGWPPFYPTWLLGNDLQGRTLGIVGYGNIGRAVARRAKAFGMRVIYHSRRGGMALPDLLGEADVVSLHVPLNDNTRGMISSSEFALMKSTAILINTARGPVLDHEALIDALAHGRIWAAGLDVTHTEPIHPDDPILSFPNCIVLPHIGSATLQTRSRMALASVDNLLAGLQRRALPHPVNPGVVQR